MKDYRQNKAAYDSDVENNDEKSTYVSNQETFADGMLFSYLDSFNTVE